MCIHICPPTYVRFAIFYPRVELSFWVGLVRLVGNEACIGITINREKKEEFGIGREEK